MPPFVGFPARCTLLPGRDDTSSLSPVGHILMAAVEAGFAATRSGPLF